MSDEYKNRVVLISGSSSGIGEQTAYKFAEIGDIVIVTYHLNKEQGERVVRKCLELGAKDSLALSLELMQDESIKNLVQQIVSKYGRIDILINNAGKLGKGNLSEQSFDDISKQIKTNLEGLIKLTHQCLPYIKESIINVGSALGLSAKGGLSVYSATKFGVRGFSQSLAKELSGIRVYTINPSLTATNMGGQTGLPPEQVAEIIKKAALGQYKAKFGADINVREYLHGETGRLFYLIGRKLKRLIRIILRQHQ
ncbi:MAG: hypothetical protein A2744_01365 [Candidatus Buchananbacteria bacterium RIFCSPHIGHO2_01_FULL_44_11]|uniref:Short-chain dehydrogenase n=1 Tax=Candidatus Buchananbacteria bacterium RIFCSPHIGHO2_01_FULL_44_11 TaxID=1797535 RepID=A0A1G1Y015_9BACT|nr:MAG: hypothetical protein A2744_01365 [Candidatus Buchananbacteria bacterium RIFCSPHIGHO2_01_FULL_44_11]